MAPKAQKEPSWIGGSTKGFGINDSEYTNEIFAFDLHRWIKRMPTPNLDPSHF